GRGAGREAGAVELALEARAALARREREARIRRIRGIRRLGVDARARRRRVDRPRVARDPAGVAGGVRRLDLERVRALGEARVALGGRAGAEPGAVELAAGARPAPAPPEGEA